MHAHDEEEERVEMRGVDSCWPPPASRIRRIGGREGGRQAGRQAEGEGGREGGRDR